MQRLSIGDAAPPFDLRGSGGRFDLDHFRGRWLVLYFYPEDFTGGCTAEACDFRDLLADMDAEVAGVSPDPPERHGAFEEAYALPFPLLSDEDHRVAERYGVWGVRQNHPEAAPGVIRSTFIIDPEGKIAAAMYDVAAQGHAARVAERLASLQASSNG